MKLEDMFAYSVKYLRTQKLRSWLTIIGIVIGVATVVALTSIGDGITREINNELSVLGTNILIIAPVNVEKMTSFTGGIGTVGKLYERDFEKVESTPGVKLAGRMLLGRTAVQFKDKGITTIVRATDAKIMTDMWPDFFEVERGRMFSDNERGVVVIGYGVANDMFGKDKPQINSIIKIGGREFRVVGILKKVGSSFSSDDDLAFYIPIRDGRELFKSTVLPNEVTIIYATVEDGIDPNVVKERIQERLDANHRVDEDTRDYSVITSDFIMKTVNNITGTLTLFLLLISSVSAFVGGIGISNTMFMSVLDRTREIGVLKSLGAKRNEILILFMIEAAILGLIGGVIGSLLGWAVASYVSTFGIMTYVNPVFIVIVLIASIAIGVVAGVIPAYNASKIPAIEALSY